MLDVDSHQWDEKFWALKINMVESGIDKYVICN